MTEKFSDYRLLFERHIDTSNQRQSASEEAITDLKVAMSVFTVKLSLIVGTLVLIGGLVITTVIKSSLTVVTETRESDKQMVTELRKALNEATKAITNSKKD
jgi:hypothetical protein